MNTQHQAAKRLKRFNKRRAKIVELQNYINQIPESGNEERLKSLRMERNHLFRLFQIDFPGIYWDVNCLLIDDKDKEIV